MQHGLIYFNNASLIIKAVGKAGIHSPCESHVLPSKLNISNLSLDQLQNIASQQNN